MEEIKPRAGILTCWKDIASFFHRDVRTVQRWEHEEGLPVHRHQHHRRSSVYAYPAELEAWWAQHQSGERAIENGHRPATVVSEPLAETAEPSETAVMQGEHPPQSRIRW